MISREDGWIAIQGNLNIATVPELFETGLKHLAEEDFQVDFSQVESVDSAAVSLLLAWNRAARKMQHALRVKGLPEDLISLAQLYGVADLLPQQSD